MDCGQCVCVCVQQLRPRLHSRDTYFQISCCMSLFYGPCSHKNRATKAGRITFILIEDSRLTHTHTAQLHTSQPVCVCLYESLSPWGGQLVQNYYTGTFSPACIIHTDKQEQLSVCVCVCVDGGRALRAERGARGELWW